MTATGVALVKPSLLVRRGWLLLLVVSLAGCPTLPVKPPEVIPWETRRAQLQAREQFELRGRVAVAAGREGFNARLRWEQAQGQTQLALDGPFGVGGLRILAEGERISLATARGEALDSEAARAELVAHLGFEPPFESLRYWVLGVPDPARPAEEQLDAEQRLATLVQDGWRIEYGRYGAVGDTWLPTRLDLSHADVRVRLVVDAWNP